MPTDSWGWQGRKSSKPPELRTKLIHFSLPADRRNAGKERKVKNGKKEMVILWFIP